jgi:hypothetical protein
MTSIIALTGFKQSGKTTAANYLETKGYVRHNMKDALITELKERFPDLLQSIIENYQEMMESTYNASFVDMDWLFEKKPPLIRALLQNFGTEVRRAEDEDYWVLQWKLGLIEHMMADRRAIVVDDCRFVSEARAIKAWGGTIIRIERTDITSGGNHQSETEMLQITPDHTITVGPGEHDKLYAELDKILS